MLKYTPQAEICRFRKYKICFVEYLVFVEVSLKTMIFQNKNETFDNFESKFFSFESALSSDNTNLVKNLSYPANPDQLQQIDSPYFQVENFITMSKQLN